MMPRSAGVPVAYLRRSRVQSTKPGTVSHETQLAAVRKVVDNDPRLVTLEDWGVSGQGRSTKKRTGYAELRRIIEAGECSQLVSYNMSRLARSVSELLSLMELCETHGVPVRTVDREIDTTTATGRMMTTILAAIDQMHAEVAREASIAGQAIARADGKVPGRPAYGTRPGQDPAAVVAAFTEAGSLNGAARLLNERKVPTWQPGGSWGTRTVKAILNRHAPGTIPAGARQGRRSFAPHALSGLLTCPCGETMTSNPRPSGLVWFCTAARTKPEHPRPYIVSDRKLWPSIKAEAARLVPLDPKTGRPLYQTGLDQDAPDNAARRADLHAQRVDILDSKQRRLYSSDPTANTAEALRRISAVDDQLAALDAQEAGAVLFPEPISWTAPAAETNVELRSLFYSITLGPDLLPLPYPEGFAWTVPEWRAED